jgi:hypothetical protein
MTADPLPTIESWVPAAVADAALRLHAELAAEDKSENGLTVLSRLISDRRMKAVWKVLYQRDRDENYRPTENFEYPAVMTMKSSAAKHRQQARVLRERGGELNESSARLLEAEARAEENVPVFGHDPRWSEQELAVRYLLEHACRIAIDIAPTYRSDIQARLKRISAVTTILREQAEELVEIGMLNEAFELGDIVDKCNELRELDEQIFETAGPRIIDRERTDPKLRTYVADLYMFTFPVFGSPLYGTLATVANVAFKCSTVTVSKVRNWLSINRYVV